LQGASLHQRMRVSGNVRAGSISHRDGQVDFVLEEQSKTLPVSYIGRDPLPDTFKDGAQALVEGQVKPDGSFAAEQVQAKCASKYQASPTGAPAVSQPGQTMNGAGGSGLPNKS
jgi:cytochrome c-type biogenesis protein CcmE